MMGLRAWVVLAAGCSMARAQAPVEKVGGTIDLPSSKRIVGVVPGGPQSLSSLPVSMATSPDGRWVVTVNAGYGSAESGYKQSLAALDTRTGKVVDYPDARTEVEAKQTLFSGLAFSADGRTLFGSIASTTDPEGKLAGDTGSGIAVYSFSSEGKIAPERVIGIPLQRMAEGRKTKLIGGVEGSMGLPYPAAISSVPRGCSRKHPCEDHNSELMLVADNLSDDVLLMEGWSGQVVTRFDLTENDAVPSTYPVALAVSRDGRFGYVALWNASEVVELDLVKGTVGRKLALLKPDSATAPGSHPDALAAAPDGRTLYVALGNRDAVAAVDLSGGGFKLKGYFDVRLPGQSFYGAQPEALAVSADGQRLYCANMGSDAVAVIDTRKMTKSAVRKGMVEPLGFVPTEWLPMGIAVSGGKLYIATGKGTGTGPNNFPQQRLKDGSLPPMSAGFKFLYSQVPATYVATLLHGSLAAIDEKTVEEKLPSFTAKTLEDNRMRAAEEKIAWAPEVLAKLPARASSATASTEAGSSPFASLRVRNDNKEEVWNNKQRVRGPIKHVIYILKENRTYDQLFGDLQFQGKEVGNGDPSLTMYGEEITPNQHKLALQFGVLDNFYDSAEVSGDGHVWSNTAIGTDYLQRTWQANYRGKQRGYDYEGMVSQGIPLQQKIPDVNEPASGYIWGNVARHGLSLYHFGEYISSKFCTAQGNSGAKQDPQAGLVMVDPICGSKSEVKPGERLPDLWGGGVNLWPWAIPLLASNTPTKPELVGHFAREYPDFNLKVPDQIRVDIFLKHLEGWIADRKGGRDTMPNFIQLRLPNDHTAGTTAGGPSPKSSVADNDLAIGRAVEAISHTAYWDDTAFFILEDDAQNGADHVDAHRSDALIVSKYAPRRSGGEPVVDSRFYSTVSMIRTMETVLGLPPMNNNDALSSLVGSLFSGAGDQPAFDADFRNRENGLIYTASAQAAVGATESAKMDFSHADGADAQKLNVILWEDAMGSRPVPRMLIQKRKKGKKDDDD